ncbi:MAG: 50S ribosomal protein L22 [Bacteroidota bacterium]
MGIRKKEMAEKQKEVRKNTFYAKLNNCPTSPRKMRLVADLIRGQEVSKALNILKYTRKEAAGRLEKLLSSAIANYESKSGQRADEGNLFVKDIRVDSGFQMKRLRPAPQGRAYRVRKRSNHVTVIVDTKQEEQNQE